MLFRYLPRYWLAEEILQENSDFHRLDTLGSALSANMMRLEIIRGGESVYTYGDSSAEDFPLLAAACSVSSGTVTISAESRGLCLTRAAADGEEYLICVYSTRTDASSIGVKVVKAVFMVIVSAFFALILLVIWGTNRFLTRFVFQKIEEPLKILAYGVEEIGTGNLDFCIQYEQQDEFAPVCAAFNDMARRLKNSVERTRREEESRKELLDGVTQSAEAQTRYLRTIKKKTEEIERMVSSYFFFLN